MVKFKSNIIKTDVTAISTIQNFIFVGVGGCLHIFDKQYFKYIRKYDIFQGDNIFELAYNSSHKIAVASGQHVKIFQFDKSSGILHEEYYKVFSDWILSLKWVNDEYVAAISMHNKLQIWDQCLEVKTEYVCEEKCILYSAYIYGTSLSNIIIFSGTVFCEVLIWKPEKQENEECLVLRRLVGHKGVIFSIHYNAESGFLCSTSDDCSAILWKIAIEDLSGTNEITEEIPSTKVYGHLSRVFRCRVLSNYFITAGEDSIVNIRTFNGLLLRKVETHQGSPIWSLDCKDDNLLITGGGDGGVTAFPMMTNFTENILQLPDNEGPKVLGILKSRNFVALSDTGILYYFSHLHGNWHKIKQHYDLKNYGLLKISKCRNLMALAGFNGQIYIYKEDETGLNFMTNYQTVSKSRIFSFHWVTCELFLICQDQGVLSLFHINKTIILHIKNFILPPSKERWPTAAIQLNTNIVVGDRKGNIHLYDMTKSQAIQTLKKVHNHLGVANLIIFNNFIISLGRDSTIKRFSILENNLIMISSDKLRFSWLLDIVDDLLIAFSGNNFVIWHWKTKRLLFEKLCGGGHRSWDFSKGTNDLIFSFIKDKSVHVISLMLDNIMPVDLIEGYHANTINALSVLKYNNYVLISGGEDTTLRIHLVENSNFFSLSVLKSHLSSIRAITVYKLSASIKDGKDIYLIFSAGGRAQVICWKLEIFLDDNTVQNVLCSEQYSYHKVLNSDESEMRIMDLVVTKIHEGIVLFCACSDGTIKVFNICYEKYQYSLSFCRDIFYNLKCILKLLNLNILGNNILVSFATDGKSTFWNTCNVFKNNELSSISSIPTHQSGINSCSYKLIDKDLCVILTGGDDNAIVASLIQFHDCNNMFVELLDTFVDSSTHCAQITGLFLFNDFFITTSIDQRITVFEWKLQNKKLECQMLSKHNTSITDIQGMQSFENRDKYEVFVYGNGLEFLEIEVSK